MLASVAQVKARVRFDHDAEDADWELAIQSASAMILNYLRDPTLYQDSSGNVLTDSNGDVLPATYATPTGVPAEVMQATILLAGMIKRDPDGKEMTSWQQGYLPWPVTAGIYMLRSPALG